MANGTYSIKITAVDGVTKKFDAINKKLASMRAPAERLNKAMARFSKLSGLQAVHAQFGKLKNRVLDTGKALTRIVAPLGAITGAASLGGLAALAAHAGDLANHLSISATRLGVTTSALQRYQAMGRLAGGSGQGFAQSIASLGDIAQGALAGRNTGALRLFQSWGMNIQKHGMVAKSGGALMRQAFEHIHRMSKFASAATMRSVQSKLGMDDATFAAALKGGAEAYDKLQAEAKHYGYQSKQAVQAGQQFYHAQQMLNLAVEGFGTMLEGKIFPILTPIITQMAQWVVQNRTWIANDITKYVKEFVQWVKTMIPQVKQAWKIVNDIVQSFGGWKAVLIGITAIRLGGWAASMVKSLNPLTIALAAIAETIYKIETFSSKGGGGDPATWKANSPFWQGMSPQEQSNYANSPRSQAFLRSAGVNKSSGSWLRDKLTHMIFGKDTTTPRGIRNNNPLNLAYMEGQGAVGTDGRFGVYGSMSQGIAADTRQLLRYQDKYHLNTVRQIINRWAPPSDGNDTDSYVQQVASALGVKPDQAIDLHQQATAAALVSAMAKRETGRALNQGDVQKGVALALGAPVQLAKGGTKHTVNGNANLNIHISGNTAGVSTTAHTNGDLFAPPRVAMAMPAS